MFSRLATSAKSEYALIIKVQEYCYENMVFQRVFQKIILLFYNTEVLSEDTILKWYREGHNTKASQSGFCLIYHAAENRIGDAAHYFFVLANAGKNSLFGANEEVRRVAGKRRGRGRRRRRGGRRRLRRAGIVGLPCWRLHHSVDTSDFAPLVLRRRLAACYNNEFSPLLTTFEKF